MEQFYKEIANVLCEKYLSKEQFDSVYNLVGVEYQPNKQNYFSVYTFMISKIINKYPLEFCKFLQDWVNANEY